MNDKINKAINKLVEMYSKLETDLLVEIASHFNINEEFINSDYWRLKKLDELGLLNKDVIEYISKYTKKTPEMVLKAMNEIGYSSFNMSDLSRAFEDEQLMINPNILINDFIVDKLINYSYKELTNTFTEISKKVEESVRRTYLNIIDEAYIKTSSGICSYQEAITSALNDLGNSGITTLTYKTTDENGNIVGIRNYDIEGTVRRDTLTSARQLSGNINQKIIEDLKPKYIYLSEHEMCRPSHFDWQGTIVPVEDYESITGYGEVDGIYGINCGHYAEPYFGDARGNDLKKISKSEALEKYRLSQKQRYIERNIRKCKRKEEIYKANDDTKSYAKCKNKVKQWQKRNIRFTEEHNLTRDYTREQVEDKNNIAFNKKYKEYNEKLKVGTFNITKYDKNMKTTTKDVVLLEKNKEHIKDKHPEVEKYIKDIPEILKNPDSVYYDLKHSDTIWIVKNLGDNIKITIKLNTLSNTKEIGYKNSIIQMQFLKDERINSYIKKGTIKKIFDKKDKK